MLAKMLGLAVTLCKHSVLPPSAAVDVFVVFVILVAAVPLHADGRKQTGERQNERIKLRPEKLCEGRDIHNTNQQSAVYILHTYASVRREP